VGFVYREVPLHCRQERPQSIDITVEPQAAALFALPTARAGL